MGENSFKNQYKRYCVKLKKIQQRDWIILSVIAIALVFVLSSSFSLFAQKDDSTEIIQEKPKTLVRDSLTGLMVYEKHMPRQVFGVIIDNHVEAQPQSGISEAFLVVEAPVEAGISRLLAFFHEDQEVSKIGPVRSARPYFIDWNNEFDALFAHVGGSNQALDEIASGGTFDLNQYWHHSSFRRLTSREAPHNVYTSIEKMSSYADERREAGRAPKLLYGIWKFKDPAKKAPEEPVELSVRFYPPQYTVSWEFDGDKMNYKRKQRGRFDKTLEGNQIIADNIAVVVTDVEIIDAIGRRKIDTIGSGRAHVFQDGIVIDATWKKNSESERLRFFDEYDEEIVFNGGATWIEVVPSKNSITIK